MKTFLLVFALALTLIAGGLIQASARPQQPFNTVHYVELAPGKSVDINGTPMGFACAAGAVNSAPVCYVLVGEY